MRTLLQISWRVSQWKNYENPPTSDEVIAKVKGGRFFETQCSVTRNESIHKILVVPHLMTTALGILCGIVLVVRPQQMHHMLVAMHRFATDVPRFVCWSVCVGNIGEQCENCGADRDAVWDANSCGPRELRIRWGPGSPHGKVLLGGGHTWRSIYSTYSSKASMLKHSLIPPLL